MNISINQVSALDVLKIEELACGRADVWFLNWKIIARGVMERSRYGSNAFSGAGLYALCFDNRLIYIGSFLGDGNKVANFSGDVVSTRWWAHIGAITARGHRVHLARSSLRSLRKNVGDDHVMLKGLINTSNSELLHKDEGDLAPLRRLNFAAQHSHIFLENGIDSGKILDRFSFTYARFTEMPSSHSGHSLREHIESAENNLIRRYAPVCNTKNVPKGMLPVEVNLNEVSEILRAALK